MLDYRSVEIILGDPDCQIWQLINFRFVVINTPIRKFRWFNMTCWGHKPVGFGMGLCAHLPRHWTSDPVWVFQYQWLWDHGMQNLPSREPSLSFVSRVSAGGRGCVIVPSIKIHAWKWTAGMEGAPNWKRKKHLNHPPPSLCSMLIFQGVIDFEGGKGIPVWISTWT